MSNPSLCALISKWLGTEAWIRNADLLTGLRDHVDNPNFHQEWKMVIFQVLFITYYMEQQNSSMIVTGIVYVNIPICLRFLLGETPC